MSNHSVGHAINEVTRGIFSRYLDEKLDKQTTKDLISLCCDCSNYEDGNWYEGIECLDYCVCGRCLKIVPKGQIIYDNCMAGEQLCTTSLCMNCLAELRAQGEVTEEDFKSIIENNGAHAIGYFIDDKHRERKAEGD